MARQILVQLRRQDPLAEFIPYIEEITRPGMRVVFLVPYPVESSTWLQDHWVTTESPRQALLAGRKLMGKYAWELQRRLAEQRIAPARQALENRGVEVVVDVYTGSLASMVESYNSNEEPQLMMQGQRQLPIVSFLREAIAFSGLFKRPSLPSVLLLRPSQ